MPGFKSKKEMAMSKVADLSYDIQEMFIDGHGAKSIARTLECPLEVVLQVLESFGVEGEDMDYDPFNTVNS